jgi:hypothetical protein
MPLTIVHATIANRASLSGAIDCSAAPPVRISAPASWTAAGLTFQVSSDGITFEDLFDITGNEVMVNVTPGTVVRLSAAWAVSPVWLKLRSGTRKAPVMQAADRIFSIAMVTP